MMRSVRPWLAAAAFVLCFWAFLVLWGVLWARQ